MESLNFCECEIFMTFLWQQKTVIFDHFNFCWYAENIDMICWYDICWKASEINEKQLHEIKSNIYLKNIHQNKLVFSVRIPI